MSHKKLTTAVLSGFVAILCFCSTPLVRADVRLPSLFSDNMVLQQGMKVAVWGWADDGEEITVTFRGQKLKTTAKDGKWMVQLNKLKAGGPDTLTVAGKNAVTLKNILVGEVWVCSGQSNMEFALKNSFESKADIDASANPNIRLFHVQKLKADQPTNDVKATWQECNPETVPGFSAVGYYFGRDLQKARNVPVGLIESDWGGSPAEVWMKDEVLESNPRYKREILDGYQSAMKNYEQASAAFETEKAEAKKSGATFSKKAPGRPSWKPTELYNGMIAPLVHYGIKGALWYQGESNAGRAEQYRTLFPDMIRNWRSDWNEGDFTFLLVQLAPFMAIKDQPVESAWAELREAQLLTTKVLPKTGMAVITDVGNPVNIHPTKKEPVGVRLALAARGIAYGEHIVYSGPIYKSMKVEGNKATLKFDNVGGGLIARDGDLKGFAVCGEDKKFVWATATIEGSGRSSRVVVSAPEVAHPIAVRYGWADCPVVNLWNKDGLPASPFRTDDFPMVTAGK
ncbi:MAG: Sialic acid-specific 9-O-acetylesterase [Pedosphaera sp.]|nr:Sialic acid-specific 9-O-acetylesterase [Pedosphaera sp.]